MDMGEEKGKERTHYKTVLGQITHILKIININKNKLLINPIKKKLLKIIESTLIKSYTNQVIT